MSQAQASSVWREVVKEWVPPAVLAQYRRMRAAPPAAPLPPREFHLPVRRLEELFPDVARSDLRVPGSQLLWDTHMVMPHAELLTLAAVCRVLSPRTVFEFGTYTGASTIVMALNCPDDATLLTLDLDPAMLDTHEHGTGVGGIAPFAVGQAFREHPAGARVRQLLGNSLTFDVAPYAGAVDLVVVDADHSYRFVAVDSEKAFAMLRPGGAIVWDDYVWDPRFPECVGVSQYLHELQRRTPCYRIAGTRLAIHLDARR